MSVLRYSLRTYKSVVAVVNDAVVDDDDDDDADADEEEVEDDAFVLVDDDVS